MFAIGAILFMHAKEEGLMMYINSSKRGFVMSMLQQRISVLEKHLFSS
jgi:hypothetical protein